MTYYTYRIFDIYTQRKVDDIKAYNNVEDTWPLLYWGPNIIVNLELAHAWSGFFLRQVFGNHGIYNVGKIDPHLPQTRI